MREILFRGRSKALDSEWLYGDVLICKNSAQIWEDLDGGKFNSVVALETIGQYTGLTDKNGKKIFEGDICSKFSNYAGKKFCFPIVFEQGLFYAKYSETAGMPLCDICEKIEIIGNIHDSPELLEGGER